MEVAINYWAVLVVAVAHMVVGTSWYGPIFGKIWTKEMGWTEADMQAAQKQGMGPTYFAALVGALICSYVLAHFVGLLEVTTVGGAVQLAFWIWLGFYATAALNHVLWEGRTKTLFAVNIGYHLVILMIATSILAVWK